jgi:hypothetical protein
MRTIVAFLRTFTFIRRKEKRSECIFALKIDTSISKLGDRQGIKDTHNIPGQSDPDEKYR